MNKRKIILGSLLGLTTTTAALVLDRSGVLVRALKPQMVAMLSKASGMPVTVERVEGGVFGTLILKGVALGPDASSSYSMTAGKVTVVFSLWDHLVRKKSPAESLRRLELDSPQIRILSSRSPSSPGVQLASFALPLVMTRVMHGRLEWAGKNLVIEDIGAEWITTPQGGDLKTDALVVLGGGRAHIQGSFAAKAAPKSPDQWIPGVDITGNINGDSLEWEGGNPSLKVAGGKFQAVLEGRRFKLDHAAFDFLEGHWIATGTVDLDRPGLKLQAKGQGGNKLKVAGLAFESADLEVDLSAEGVVIDKLALRSGQGTLNAAGRIGFGAQKTLDIRGSLAEFALEQPRGGISGRFSLSGGLEKIRIEASLTSPQLEIHGERFERCAAIFDVQGDKGKASLSGDWRGIKGLRVAGSLRLSQGLGAELQVAPFEIAPLLSSLDLPPLLRKTVAASLRVDGSADKPRLDFVLDGSALESSDGKPCPAVAKGSLADGRLILTSLDVRTGQLRGHGTWSEDPSSEMRVELRRFASHAGILEGSLSLRGGSKAPALNVDLTSSGIEFGGVTASAALRGTWSRDGWRLADLRFTQPQGGVLRAEGGMDSHGKAELNASAKNWRWGVNELGGVVSIRGERAGQIRKWFDAAGGSTTATALRGSWKATELVAGARPLDPASGSWEWTQGEGLRLKDLSWSQGWSGSASLRKNLDWRVDLSAKDAKIDGLLALLGFVDRSAPERLSADLDAEGQAGSSGILHFRLGTQFAMESAWIRNESGTRLWRGKAAVKAWELEQALQFAALAPGNSIGSLPQGLSGRLNGDAVYDGRAASPLSFSVSVDALRQGARSWGSLKAEGSASARALRLERAELGTLRNRLTLTGFDLKKAATGVLKVSSAYRVTDFPETSPVRFAGEGSLKATLDPTGTFEAELGWKDLKLNRLALEPGAIVLQWKDKVLRLREKGRAPHFSATMRGLPPTMAGLESLKLQWGQGAVLEAAAGHDEEGEPRLEASARGVPLGQIAQLMDWTVPMSGALYGNGVYRDAQPSGGLAKCFLSLKIENGDLAGFPFDLVQGSLRLENGRLDLKPSGEPLRVSRRGRYLAEIEGTMPLGTQAKAAAAPEEMDLKARLVNANLGMLDFIGIVDAGSGTVNAEWKVTGTPKFPEFSGKIDVENGELRFKRFLAPATGLKANVRVDQNKLEILRLDAQIGGPGQRIYVEQGSSGPSAVDFERWVISRLNLKLSTGKGGIQARASDRYEFITGNLVLDPKPGMLLTGDMTDPVLQGTLRLANATVTYPVIDKDHRPFDPQDFSGRMLWDLKVTTGEKVVFVNPNARAEISTGEQGLMIQGLGRDLSLKGRITPSRGHITFFSSEFQISDAQDNYIEFMPGQAPQVRLSATKYVRSSSGNKTLIRLDADGPLDHLNGKPTAPGNTEQLDEAQIASMAGFGTDITGKSGGIEQALGTMVSRQLVGLLSSRFKEVRDLDISVSAPGLWRAVAGDGARGANASADALGNTGPGREIGAVEVGNYLPGGVYGSAGIKVKEGNRGGTDTVIEYGVEREVGAGQKVKLSGGSDETRAEYRAQSALENYDPKKRRRELERQRESRLSATPTPVPSPFPTPKSP